MNKDAYYFPHFSNARHDRRLRRVRKELGVEGYGIYFMLLEVLRDQPKFAYPICDVDLLADDFGTSEPKVNAVISNYGLFIVENEVFTSNKFHEYLAPYLAKSERARNAALIRWNSKSNANALPQQSKSNASKVKYSKVKYSKEEESKSINGQKPEHTPRFIPPTIEEIKTYCLQNNKNVDAERFFNFYESKGWMVGKSKMKNWHAALANWDKESTPAETEQERKARVLSGI